jgi:hypothetical protein
MTPNEHFSQLAAETGMEPKHLAEALAINYRSLIAFFSGRLEPKPELIGDTIQLLEDIAYEKAAFQANPAQWRDDFFQVLRSYRIKQRVVEEMGDENSS